MTIQEIYYSIGAVVAPISLLITIAVYIRSKPDRIKAAIQSSLEPLIKRLDAMEKADEEQADKQQQQALTLARLESDFRHMPNDKDIQNLHARIGEVLKATAESNGRWQAYNEQVQRMQAFLMRSDR